MFGCSDKFAVVRAMCTSTSCGNARVKAAMISKITEIVREIYVENPSVIQNSVVPMAVHIAETESKGEVRVNVNTLLMVLSVVMKDAFKDALDALGVDKDVKDRVIAVAQSAKEETKRVRR